MQGQYFSTFWRKLTKPKNTFFIGSALEEEEEGETATNIRRRQRQTGDKVQEIKFSQSFYDEMLFGKSLKRNIFDVFSSIFFLTTYFQNVFF